MKRWAIFLSTFINETSTVCEHNVNTHAHGRIYLGVYLERFLQLLEHFCLFLERYRMISLSPYLQMRKLVQYDDTGFFTALIVMYTLQIHNYWYSWREADYSPEYYNQ